MSPGTKIRAINCAVVVIVTRWAGLATSRSADAYKRGEFVLLTVTCPTRHSISARNTPYGPMNPWMKSPQKLTLRRQSRPSITTTMSSLRRRGYQLWTLCAKHLHHSLPRQRSHLLLTSTCRGDSAAVSIWVTLNRPSRKSPNTKVLVFISAIIPGTT
jgi:hypothetical protein